jgi:hypothetical protein
MRLRRLALLLAVVGLVCLPAPLYLGWAAETAAPPPKSSQVYGADARDPADASDRKHVVYRHAGDVALSTHRVSERYSAGEYRAPNESRRTLERAMASGSATTDDPGAKADLRGIGDEYAFVYDAYGDAERRSYHRLTVTENGSRVATENVTLDRVANATIDRRAVEYASLSPGERRTVDRVLERDSGYRPGVDDPFVDRLPALVWVDGTLYSLHVVGHVDDFGPGFAGFVVGLGVAAVGALLLLASGAAYLLARRRD